MTRKDLTSFEIDDQGFKLKIERGSRGGPAGVQMGYAASPMVMSPPAAQPAAELTQTPPPAQTVSPEPEVEAHYIKSPIVGTFYSATTPEADPYVKPGSMVSEKSVVCIIEAMKVMNEITAETEGEILEALVENGTPVEYGQPLFKIKKA